MCRILSYLGTPILVEELLYKPDNSFIKQSYHPQYMSHLLNLAGFGLAAWDHASFDPERPYLYRTAQLPFYDENLRNLAAKISPYCLLAHLRGVAYSDKQVVSTQNVHPFLYPTTHIALAHNGVLYQFDKMKFDFLDYIDDEYKIDIHGTTDSEWIYSIFLSQLKRLNKQDERAAIATAIIETLKILVHIRHKHNVCVNSPVNLFITNGKMIAATRFVLDYGWQPNNTADFSQYTFHSLWYTYGEKYGFHDNEYKMKDSDSRSSVIIASEPLTEDTTTWIEVPEYTLVIAHRDKGAIEILSQDIHL